jgi:putative transposase
MVGWSPAMTYPCSKEVPVVEVDVSIDGALMCWILDRRFLTRPLPETLILDNGPEFAGTAFDAGPPTMASFSTLFNPGSASRMRLSKLQRQVSGRMFTEHWFLTLQEA